MKISTLARKNARQSKSVILMIALACMLICTVVNLGFSMQQAMIDDVTETSGDNHAMYRNITEEQEELLAGHRDIERLDLHLNLDGWGNPTNNGADGIGLVYSSALGQVAGFKFTSGRAPEAENEAAIPPHVAELLGIEPKVGSEFEIVYSTTDGTEQTLRFVVSGILQQERMHAAMRTYMMFISRPLAQRFDYSRDLFLRIKGNYVTTKALDIAEEIGVERKDVSFNEQYLSANAQDPVVVVFVGVILLILVAAGALVIYNAYNLSIEKKIHQYGLLILIGASKKQIRNCVKQEALYCAVFGLPLGLLAGTAAGWASAEVFSAAIYAGINYVLAPAAYVISAAVTLLMVYIGVSRPAKKASRVAPVEAVRFSDVTEMGKVRATIENVTPAALAKLNLSRKRGRTISTVLSLTLSGVLFLGISTVAFSMRNSVDVLASQMTDGDILIETTGDRSIVDENGNEAFADLLPRDLVNTIGGLDGVEKMEAVALQYTIEKATLSDGTEYNYVSNTIAGLSKGALQNVIDNVYDGEVTMGNFIDPHSVIAVIPSEETIDRYRSYDVGYDDILAKYQVGAVIENNGAAVNIIGLVCKDDIPAYAENITFYPVLYTLRDNFEAQGWDSRYRRLIVDIDDEKYDNISAALTSLLGAESLIKIESFRAVKDELIRQIMGVTVIILLMIAVIALIGFLNLVASTFMGVEQRKKELGVLMAVGLSRKGVGRMLTREGVWVSLLCALLSAAAGLALGIGLYKLLVYIGADYLSFSFPLWPLVALVTVYGVVPFGITMAAVHRLQRFTTVELLGRQV